MNVLAVDELSAILLFVAAGMRSERLAVCVMQVCVHARVTHIDFLHQVLL
jgi:hypothetical protein